jgi:hypothetical protein
MNELICTRCGLNYTPPLSAQAKCPHCGELAPAQFRLSGLKQALQQAEKETEKLKSRPAIFARAKSGALKAKIATLKKQIEHLEQENP